MEKDDYDQKLRKLLADEYGIITDDELLEIAEYTVQKIVNYPKSLGKTVENYFDLLFPDEVKNHIARREINRQSETNRLRRAEVMA